MSMAEPPIVAEVFDKAGATVDTCYTWEAGQTYANEGYRVVALADDGFMDRERAQRLYDTELAAAVDCFGEGWVK